MMSFVRSPKLPVIEFSMSGNSSRGTRAALAIAAAALLAGGTLVPLSAQAGGACSVWPEKVLRVNADGDSSLVFLLRTTDGRVPGNVASVGGLFFKYDPSKKCRGGNRSAACRDVGVWSEIPAIETDSPQGEWSVTLYLGSTPAPFWYEGVFWVQYRDGRREWLNNASDSRRNFWFTDESTRSLPSSDTWDFNFARVPTTASIRHWSNPDRCAD